MTKPIRWSEDGSGASELERAILRSDRGLEPPPGEEALGWKNLAAELGLPGSLPDLVSSNAAAQLAPVEPAALAGSANITALVPAATGSFAFLKGVAVGVLFSGALWQTQQWLGAEAPVTQRAAPVAGLPVASTATDRSNVPLPTPPVARDERAPAASAAVPSGNVVQSSARSLEPVLPPPPRLAPSVVAFGEVSEPPRTAGQGPSQLKEEAGLLRQARARLRANELAEAFGLLETSRRRFSTPELDQEREALSIELLFRSGQAQAAGARARAFLARFPESPHAARLRDFAGTGSR